MIDSKSIVTGLVTLAVTLLIGSMVWGGSQGPAGPAGTAGKDGKNGQSLGALSSPDISSPYISWGGMRTFRAQTTLTNATAATNTPCILTSPAATSTLVFAALRVDTASSTATGWHVSKGTGTSEATTTANSLGTYTLGSGALGTFPVRAALSTVDPVSVFSPNQKLVWTIAGTVIADTSKFNGVCQAEWVTI